MKRSLRDPYGDYTAKQERRNYGEPVHEDNDMLGVFSLEVYRHMTPGQGAVMWAGFIGVVLSLYYVCSLTYPDSPSAPRDIGSRTSKERGGPGVEKVSHSMRD